MIWEEGKKKILLEETSNKGRRNLKDGPSSTP